MTVNRALLGLKLSGALLLALSIVVCRVAPFLSIIGLLPLAPIFVQIYRFERWFGRPEIKVYEISLEELEGRLDPPHQVLP